MLRPPIANLGVKGIRKAAAMTRRWPESMDDTELRQACANVFIYIDAEGGTGGGIFRYMYGRFLQEAAAITGDGRLAEVGEAMREIGDRWQEVAGFFRSAQVAPDPGDLLADATRRMEQIAEREQAAWEKLGALVG